MVAWNPKGKGVLLIPHDYFHALVQELLADQGDAAKLTMFAFRISHHMRAGLETENDRLQQLLSQRLLAKMESGPVPIVQYCFRDDEARKHIDDFLEAYKFNQGHIGYAIGRLDDGSDQVINISLRGKPSLRQRLTGRLGDARGEINVLRSQIVELSGTPFSFSLRTKSGLQYLFNDAGVQKA